MVKRLPYKIFIESFKHVPRIAVNLLLKKKGLEFLLTKRAIAPEKGSWHIPGSFLLKGERLLDGVERVGIEELGVKIDAKKVELLGVFDNIDKDPRGHVVDIIYCYTINQSTTFVADANTKEVKFFRKIPSGIGFTHGEILKNFGYK